MSRLKNMLDEFDDLSKKDIDEASDNGAALISKFKREYKKKDYNLTCYGEEYGVQ